MRLLRRQALAWLTIVAVLFVSATCTSAGCLLRISESPQGAAAPDCCHPESHSRQTPSGGERCPLCRQSNLIAPTADAGLTHSHFTVFSPVFFSLVPAFIGTPCLPRVHQDTGESFAFLDPPTLLGLHCALLT
jgi:hypothetical protein